MTILVARNEDEPIEFGSMKEFLNWIGEKTDDLKVVQEFFNGGYIIDSSGNKYWLADLP